MSFNLAVILRESRTRAPEAPCLYDGGQTYTYAEVDDASSRVADGLRRRGLRPGCVLALALPNCADFVIAYFGALKAGVTVLPLNPLYKATELAYHLADAGALSVVAHPVSIEQVRGAVAQLPDTTVYVTAGARADGERSFGELTGGADYPAPIDPRIEPTRPTDIAVLLYTSGTTGRPKGAPLEHFQLYMNCMLSADVAQVRADDVSLAALPLFHVFGLSGMLNVSIHAGAALSLMARFDARAALEQMHRDAVSIMVGVPTVYFALLNTDSTPYRLPRLRIGCSGGAPMPLGVLTAFEERFGVVVIEGYGLSETASSTTVNRPADRRPGSAGRPIWGVQVRIADEDGQPLDSGPEHVGEVMVMGHNVFGGYHHRPEANRASFVDGWFRTGDLGYLDHDGFLYIVDRKKDMIIRGGYNVYPREIEEVLYTHPAVVEAAVVGRPDERLGEEVHAVVVLDSPTAATEAELVDYCRQRLTPYKYPRTVRITTELPKGPTGKILKQRL